MEIEKLLLRDAALVNDALPSYLETTDDAVGVLYESMRYSALSGGKRIRPFLVLEFCRMFGGGEKAALPFACAIECVHASSLIHDDMPCMDNDALRRGKPTNHIVFGEDIALLAGDALITRGYEIAARNSEVPPQAALSATAMLLRAAGAEGMMGGQQIDLAAEKKRADFDTLLKMHAKKNRGAHPRFGAARLRGSGNLLRSRSACTCRFGLCRRDRACVPNHRRHSRYDGRRDHARQKDACRRCDGENHLSQLYERRRGARICRSRHRKSEGCHCRI